MQDTSIVYKLMVLYLLKVAEYPLTNSDICDYILMRDYTDSMTLQITITNLINDKLIIDSRKNNRTYLELSAEGIDTINSLENRLAQEIKKDIYSYIAVKDRELRNSHSVQTEIVEENDEYIAAFAVYENDKELLELKVSFPTQALAKCACENFEDTSCAIYKYVIENLLK